VTSTCGRLRDVARGRPQAVPISILIVVSVKYVAFMLGADNDGEGGKNRQETRLTIQRYELAANGS